MPTIRIHVPAKDAAWALVASLLNSGYRIEIELDEVAATTASTMPVLNWTPAKPKTSTKRAKRAQVEAANDARRTEARIAIRETACPACKAVRYEQCVSPSGAGYGQGFVHIDRIAAARVTYVATGAEGRLMYQLTFLSWPGWWWVLGALAWAGLIVAFVKEWRR